MATNIAWKVSQLERETGDGYVYTIHYTVTAEDGVYSQGAYGSIGLERPEGDLVPYDSLTEEIVVGWLKEKLTQEKVDEIEAALQSQLDEKRAPTKAAGIPWAG